MTPEVKGFLLFSIIKLLVVFTMVLVGVALLTLMERKLAGWIQNRPGPNRVGPWGILQPAADGIKNFIKEETRPAGANQGLFLLAPALGFIPALTLMAVIPLAAPLPLDVDWTLPLIGRVVYHGPLPMVVADLPIGFLFILGMSSLGVYGIALAGWASNSKYSLLGGLRASAQMISYEVAMGLSLIPVLLLSGNVGFSELVARQQAGLWYRHAALPVVLHLPRVGIRRDQPAAVRPAGGGVGAGRGLSLRVQRDEVLDVHDRGVRAHRDRSRRCSPRSSSADGTSRSRPGTSRAGCCRPWSPTCSSSPRCSSGSSS